MRLESLKAKPARDAQAVPRKVPTAAIGLTTESFRNGHAPQAGETSSSHPQGASPLNHDDQGERRSFAPIPYCLLFSSFSLWLDVNPVLNSFPSLNPLADHMEVDSEPQEEEPYSSVILSEPAPSSSMPQVPSAPSQSLKKQKVHINQNHRNPFLRISAPRDRDSSGISKPHAPAATTFREGGLRLIVKQPSQSLVSPYNQALEAVAKLKPIVGTRTFEKEQGLNPVETLNFSMLTNVETIVDSDRGAELAIAPIKKRIGRPPKRRDPPPGITPSSSQQLHTPQAQAPQWTSTRTTTPRRAKLEAAAVLGAQAAGEENRRLTNWYEGIEDENWSSEESEVEDEDLEAKMLREREADERRMEARDRQREKKAKEREEFLLQEAQKQEEGDPLQGYEDAVAEDDQGVTAEDLWGSEPLTRTDSISIKFNFGGGK